MGNYFSWHARVSADKKSVLLDVSHMLLHISSPSLPDDIPIALKLPRVSIELGDIVRLARNEAPLIGSIPIGIGVEQRVNGDEDSLDSDLFKEGVRETILRHEDPRWRNIGKVETEIGHVMLEAQVAATILGIARAEKKSGGWLKRGGTFIIARAEGSIVAHIRGRFETGIDRAQEVATAMGAVAASLCFVTLFFFGSLRKSAHKSLR